MAAAGNNAYQFPPENHQDELKADVAEPEEHGELFILKRDNQDLRENFDHLHVATFDLQRNYGELMAEHVQLQDDHVRLQEDHNKMKKKYEISNKKRRAAEKSLKEMKKQAVNKAKKKQPVNEGKKKQAVNEDKKKQPVKEDKKKPAVIEEKKKSAVIEDKKKSPGKKSEVPTKILKKIPKRGKGAAAEPCKLFEPDVKPVLKKKAGDTPPPKRQKVAKVEPMPIVKPEKVATKPRQLSAPKKQPGSKRSVRIAQPDSTSKGMK